MRRTAAAIVAVALGLVAANMLGVASAEAPTTAPISTAAPMRTVSVEGVANVSVAQSSSAAVATEAYRQGMAAAVADGQSKAEFLAAKTGTTLGSVQSIAEDGGSIQCTGGEESSYVEYQGEQPDFGSSAAVSQRLVAAPATPTVRKPAVKQRKRKVPSARKADAETCTLSAQVSLVYLIN